MREVIRKRKKKKESKKLFQNEGGKFNQGQADTSRYMKSNMLIKNARLNSAMGGKVEELRDVNILRSFTCAILGNRYVFELDLWG